MIQKIKESWQFFLMASLTLGLAPFNPPHLWGKLKWIAGGGAFSGKEPMQLVDLGDLLMHGAPWVFLIISAILNLMSIRQQKK